MAHKGFSQLAHTFTAGPKLGFNISKVPSIANAKYITGFTGGGFIQYCITDHLGFNADLLYAERGSKYVKDDIDLDLRLNYLEVPILFNYYYGDKRTHLHPKANIGPVVGLMIEALQTGVGYVTQDFRTLNYGMRLGTGFNYHASEHSWVNFDLSYTLGLAKVADDNAPSLIHTGGLKNRSIDFVISFGIDLNQ